MARRPAIPEEEYARIIVYIAAQGFDTMKLLKVPQR